MIIRLYFTVSNYMLRTLHNLGIAESQNLLLNTDITELAVI